MDLTNTAHKSPVGPHAPIFPLPASNYKNQPHDIWSAELNVRPDGEMMTMYRYSCRTGFLGVLAPSVSIKDRPLSAVLIGD